ncbi:ubiquinone-dependent pyruvate dehydrogenase [Salinisphaera orenii]|uniref:ubiquinone-dependent pyruvate dehydrogenase n=1 Tax=Salinisphaera orenii TaxID=856731 RepID=UPI000DBE072E
MAKPNVATVLVDLIARAGASNVWGLPGDSLNGVTAAIRTDERLTWRGVCHEETAALAASAEAEATGGLAVCAGSCGPGNLHLINGLFEAKRANVPMLAIAAQIPSSEIGLGYFQETRPQNLFTECSDYCELVSTAGQLPEVLTTAVNTALAEHSVAVLVLPGDVALAEAPVEAAHWYPPVPPVVRPLETELERAAATIDQSKKTVLLAGYGCDGQHDAVVELAERLKAPIVHALRGKQSLEYDNPFDVGMTGLIGFSSGYHAMRECDLLLMLGTNFPYREFFPDHGNIIQLDVRGGHIGRRSALTQGLVGDIGTTLAALTPKLTEKTSRKFLERCQQHYRDTRSTLDELAQPRADNKPLHPQYLTARISALAAQDTVFTCDVGTPTVWAARYIGMTRARRLTGSFMHGSMATATPQAMGWQAAFPDRQVIALAGDGGLSMLMGELVTLAAESLPVKVIVYNNETLGFVAMEMKAAGYLDDTTNLAEQDYASVAEALGIRGFRVTSSNKIDDTLAEAFAFEGPAVIDVKTAKQELSMPPKIEAKQARGFSLYMLRAVMNGRGDEVVDLATTNWLSGR